MVPYNLKFLLGFLGLLCLVVYQAYAVTVDELAVLDALDAACEAGGPWNRSDPCASTDIFTCVSEAITEIDFTYTQCVISHIPVELGLLTNLTSLQLSPLTGPIPTELSALVALTTFKLLGNTTTTILQNVTTVNASLFADWVHLEAFSITHSNLTSFPLAELVDVFRESDGASRVIDLSYGKLGDTAALISGANYTDLTGPNLSLDLSHNLISGPLATTSFGELNNGGTIDLSYNLITGSLRPSVYQFNKIYLSYNLLTGLATIPEEAGVSRLRINNNLLVGTIPSEFHVTELRAANNRLVGTIPSLLTDGTLAVLDVSNNTMSGPLNYTGTTGLTSVLKIVQDGTTFCPVNNLTAFLAHNDDVDDETTTDYDTFLEAGECAPCGTGANETWSPTCSGVGLCTPGNESDYTCTCYNGTAGYYCEEAACSVDPTPCGAHGTCEPVNIFPFYECTCDVNYFGSQCTSHIPRLTDRQVIVSMTAFIVCGVVITFMAPAGILKMATTFF